MAPIELSISQSFELERMRREIDAQADPEQLRILAKQLLVARFSEQAATNQKIREQLAAN